MRRAPRGAASVLAVVAACLGGSAAADPAGPDPQRLALGRQLSDELAPGWRIAAPQIAAVELAIHGGLVMSYMRSWFDDTGDGPHTLAFGSFNLRQLHASLAAGATAVAPRLREVRAEAYAQAYDLATLEGAAQFFGRPEELKSLARRAAITDQLDELGDDAGVISDPARSAKYVAQSQALFAQLSAASPAEQAFMASPTSQAFQRGAVGVQRAFDDAASPVWPDLAAAAKADYCAKRPCGEEERRFFAALPKALDLALKPPPDTRLPANHEMGGQSAAALFARPQDAALAKAACAGDADAVAAAVKAGGNPNAVGGETLVMPAGFSEEVTPLLWAMDCRSRPGTEALLSAGANPNAHDKYGNTAVTVAASLAEAGPLQLLLKRGGDPNARDDHGAAIDNELRYGHSEAGWEALLAAGADCRTQAPGGSLAFAAALANEWGKVAELLNRGCSADLDQIAWDAQQTETAFVKLAPDRAADRDRVIALLTARGLHFPVGPPPLPERYLGRDGAVKTTDSRTMVELAPGYFYLPAQGVFVGLVAPAEGPAYREVTEDQLRVAGATSAELAAVKTDPHFKPVELGSAAH